MSTVPPPEVLKKGPYIPDKLLFGPGPSNMGNPIQASLNNPLLGHLHTEFTQVSTVIFKLKLCIILDHGRL